LAILRRKTIIAVGMDWFFAINDSSAAFGIYTRLAKVAVHTALTHTSLRPRMLYDGRENAFTTWMRDRGIDVIFTESYLKKDLPKLSGLMSPAHLTLLPGVFGGASQKKTRVAIEHLRHRNPGLQSSKPSRLQRPSSIE
jgi:hypothetical protein